MRQSYFRNVTQNQPRVAYATAQLTTFGSQRPQDVNAGADAVRSHLWTLANVGLFGNPEDEDATRSLIEQTVGFYLQAWGDNEKMFNAELGEIASRAALNNANAAYARSRITSEAAPGAGAGGVNLDQLKLWRDITNEQIAAVEAQAGLVGCKISDFTDRAGALGTGSNGVDCQVYADQIAMLDGQYRNILHEAGYNAPPGLADMTRLVATVTAEVRQNMPGATEAQVEAETQRRLSQIFGFQGVTGGENIAPQTAPAVAPAPAVDPGDPSTWQGPLAPAARAVVEFAQDTWEQMFGQGGTQPPAGAEGAPAAPRETGIIEEDGNQYEAPGARQLARPQDAPPTVTPPPREPPARTYQALPWVGASPEAMQREYASDMAALATIRPTDPARRQELLDILFKYRIPENQQSTNGSRMRQLIEGIYGPAGGN
jgi:hypothetical protein